MNFSLSENSVKYQARYYMMAVGYPICFALQLTGMLLSLLVITRSRKLRSYSSSVYLVAMMMADVLWVANNFLPGYLITMNPSLTMSNHTCRAIQSFIFTGRLGSTLILTLLTLERVLINLMPGRLIDLATNKVALVFCIGVTILTTGLSMIGVSGHYWNEKFRKCSLISQSKSTISSTATLLVRMVLLYGFPAVQLVLITVLGIVIFRKRRVRKRDHVEGYISAARQQTNHLNRVNLIALLMSAKSLLTNVPIILSPTIYWTAAQGSVHFTMGTALVITRCLDLLTLSILASKAFVIIAASPKIRKQVITILFCKQRPAGTAWTSMTRWLSNSTKSKQYPDSHDESRVGESTDLTPKSVKMKAHAASNHAFVTQLESSNSNL